MNHQHLSKKPCISVVVQLGVSVPHSHWLLLDFLVQQILTGNAWDRGCFFLNLYAAASHSWESQSTIEGSGSPSNSVPLANILGEAPGSKDVAFTTWHMDMPLFSETSKSWRPYKLLVFFFNLLRGLRRVWYPVPWAPLSATYDALASQCLPPGAMMAGTFQEILFYWGLLNDILFLKTKAMLYGWLPLQPTRHLKVEENVLVNSTI